MKRLMAATFVSLLAVSAPSFAAAPVLKVSKTVSIDAPVNKVWDQVKNFNGLNTWHPAVEKDEIIKGKNNMPGAVRHLSLKGGGFVEEKLLAINNAKHMFKYTIVGGVLPVSHYYSTLTVKASKDGKGSEVTWAGDFKRKDTGSHPAANANDKTAEDTVASVYQSGLDNLKSMMEKK